MMTVSTSSQAAAAVSTAVQQFNMAARNLAQIKNIAANGSPANAQLGLPGFAASDFASALTAAIGSSNVTAFDALLAALPAGS
jgi:hypothetical protein